MASISLEYKSPKEPSANTNKHATGPKYWINHYRQSYCRMPLDGVQTAENVGRQFHIHN